MVFWVHCSVPCALVIQIEYWVYKCQTWRSAHALYVFQKSHLKIKLFMTSWLRHGIFAYTVSIFVGYSRDLKKKLKNISFRSLEFVKGILMMQYKLGPIQKLIKIQMMTSSWRHFDFSISGTNTTYIPSFMTMGPCLVCVLNITFCMMSWWRHCIFTYTVSICVAYSRVLKRKFQNILFRSL